MKMRFIDVYKHTKSMKEDIMIEIIYGCHRIFSSVSTCAHSSCRTSTRYIFSRPALSGTRTYERTSGIFNH